MTVAIPLFFLFSCNVSKKAINNQPSEAESISKANFKSSKVLSEKLSENEFDYEWMTSKFDVESTFEGNKNNFTVSVRAKKDSLIWMSISPALGIEVIRLMLTQDSVKLINRIDSKYFCGDFNYLSQLLHTDLDFDMLQSLLIGNSVSFDHEESKLKSMLDNKRYLLSTVRKRKLRKVLNEKSDLNGKLDMVQSIWLEPETYKISHIYIEDFQMNRSFDANYSDFRRVDSLSVPFKLEFTVKAEKNIHLSIDYSKISRTITPQTFPFSIPSKYEKLR